MTEQVLDQAKSEAFAGQMVGMLNSAGVALMASVGDQVGLFDKMAGMQPATSQQIAEAAGLNERYVREWLATMVTGHVVEHNGADETYWLPPEHAAWLTHAAGTNNLAHEATFVPLLAQVEPGIVESFRNGGGVPYAEFPRFQQLMAEFSGAIHDDSLVDKILPLAPDVVEKLRSGASALDVGCGRGHAVNLMARAFPNSRFTGFDFSTEGIAAGQAEAARLGINNARFEVRDVATLAEAAQFDLITGFDVIHDQAKPDVVLRGIGRALRPGGTFLMVDIAASSKLSENLGHPFGAWMYATSCMHCMTVSLALGGQGLGAMWGEQTALRMLTEAGFANVDVKRIDGDLFNNYYIAKRD